MDQLRTGALVPGARVPPEPQLCIRLGVGRSSVREAIQRLVAANLLEIRPGTGTFVRASTPGQVVDAADLARLLVTHSVLDLIELRLVFEAGVVELATARATPDDVQAIRRALQVNERAVHGSGSPVDADEQFHAAVATATHNPAMIQMMALLNGLFRHSREKTSGLPGANERAYRAHQEVFDAVLARDPSQAQAAMRANLDELRRNVVTEAHQIIEQANERAADRQRPDDGGRNGTRFDL